MARERLEQRRRHAGRDHDRFACECCRRRCSTSACLRVNVIRRTGDLLEQPSAAFRGGRREAEARTIRIERGAVPGREARRALERRLRSRLRAR